MRFILGLFLAVLPVLSPASEFGTLIVTQFANNNNSVSSAQPGIAIAYGPGKSPVGTFGAAANRADYDMTFGFANDTTTGMLITSIAQLGRNDSAVGGPATGTFYAMSMTAITGTNYFIPVHQAIADTNVEVNYNVSYAFLPYTEFVGGIATNSTDNGAITSISGSAGLALNTHFTDSTSTTGTYTLNINGFSANGVTVPANASANGVLLVVGAKNEDNFALSQANADGTFTIFCKDTDADAATYENDPVGFSYIPVSAVGTKRLVALGRVNGNATTDVRGGNFTVTSGANGQWYLTIANHSRSTGTLIVSPAGGVSNNRDNIVAAGWDAANNRWIIESRDLPGAGLQNIGGTENVFSFAFFAAPVVPTASITGPAANEFVGPATFTVEAEAADANGTVTQVEFLRNGVVVGTDSVAPYTYTETALTGGVYNYVARATDNGGETGLSAVKTIKVTLDPNDLPANTALYFDGVNDYVTMGAAPQLNVAVPPTTGFTLECWFRKEGAGITTGSGSGGVTGVPLFGKGRGEDDGSNIDCNIFFGINTAGILVADFESQATGLNHPITATNTPIVNNQWYHAAVTYSATTSTWTMYLNGVQVGTASASIAGSVPRYDSIQHFGIGTAMNSSGTPEGAFAGVIDEARVWNYARSGPEIAAARSQEIGSASGLIGRFGLNEGDGKTATSSVGSSVGTLMNGPIWVPGAPFATANGSPTVSLIAPADETTTYPSVPVTFEATAADVDGSVAKVQFRVNGAVVGEDNSAPYSYEWAPSAIGDYAVSARVVDNLGATAVTSAVTVHVVEAIEITPAGPEDGATITGTAANLSVGLRDPEGDAMTVTFYGRYTTPATPGPDFTMIAIPDTQYYSEGSPNRANTVTVQQLIGTFGAQTQWVVDNKATRNIAFVSHMGDIVEHGNNGGNDIEWQRASAAMGNLEHPVNAMRAHGIPFGLAPGNHDIDPIGQYDTGSTSFYNQFFNLSRFQGRTYWGGNYGVDNTNNYQLWSASGLDFISIHMSYDTTPNQAILDWADTLLKTYPHRRAIVTSHWIIGQGNPATFSAQGSAIYNNLKDNPNLFLLLCGHIHAEGRRSDVFEGRTVYSVLSDYQGLPNGGQGLLRTFTFSPANNRIGVASWSPTQNRTALASDNLPHFDGAYNLTYNLQTPVSDFVELDTVSVPAGGTTASANWSGLELGKNFEWYVAVSDGVTTSSSPVRRFTTAAGTPPVVTLDAPAPSAAYSTPAVVNFQATASDPDGTVVRVEFYANGTKVGEDTDAPYTTNWTGPMPGSYVLSAVAVDNSGLATLSNSAAITVTFGNFPPTVSLTAPANGALYQAPATVVLAATASDTEGPVAKVEFYSDDTLLGEDTEAPFTFDLPNLNAGTYTLTAVATDSVGQAVTSAPVTISVFTEAAVPNTTIASVGIFDLPTWTVSKTSPAPRQFNLPGTDVGDLELKINSASVPFNGGITLATNWNSPGTIASGTTAFDNISQPYANASGNVFVSVLDNSNNNAADGNPTTTEQTSGISVAYLPYSGGWTGASVASSGAVLSGNLPQGVSVIKAGGAGTYTVSGLSTAGNLLAFTNGDTGTLADNVVSVRIVNGQWVIDTRDNAGGTQDNEFSFVYIPPTTRGVFAGALSGTGVVSAQNTALAGIGATATTNADYIEIRIGDGTVINPTTATIFLVGDSTVGGAGSAAVDNLIAWNASGNSFRIFTQDIPEINGTYQAINLRFAVIPFAPIVDTDGDGIPDEWEISFNLNPYSAGDAALDTDGDGLNNLDEYRAGTNPRNAADKPRVSSVAAQPDGSMLLQIPTAAGKTYRVEANNAFPTGSWSIVGDNISGTGGLVAVPDPGAASIPNRIYRVTVLP